ncbi:MAG: DUF4157 domain-containing protein [Acidobacteriota bacterium]|nr:DUF4157 domain-containing protein [Acidobacteriota bacterium]
MTGRGLPSTLAGQLRPEFPSELDRARLHRGRLARLLTSLAGASAIVLGRRIFLSRAGAACVEDAAPDAFRLLAHELTHVAQYRRLGAAPFLGRYVGEYLRGRFAGLDHRTAYLSISFEREAEGRARSCAAGTSGSGA